MFNFLLAGSIVYFFATLWYFFIDRKDKKKVFFIPSEFLYVALTVGMFLIYFFYVEETIIFHPEYENGIESILYKVGVGLILSLIVVHAISKFIDDRTNFTQKCHPLIRYLIHFTHLRFSHKLLYISAAMVLVSFAIAEMKNTASLDTQIPGRFFILLSASLFIFAFYRTIIHGNTWRAETVTLPSMAIYVLARAKQLDFSVIQSRFALFTVLVLSLTPLLIISEKMWQRRKRDH